MIDFDDSERNKKEFFAKFDSVRKKNTCPKMMLFDEFA